MTQECTTPTPNTVGSREIDELTIRRPLGVHAADALVWRRRADIALTDEQRHLFGPHHYAAVLVRLGVDGGMFDVVEASTDGAEIEALDRVIEALQTVRDELVQLGHSSTGHCMSSSETGRCRLDTAHAGEHEFPPERTPKRSFDLSTLVRPELLEVRVGGASAG